MISISAYLYIAKTKILASLAYRFDVFSTLITNFIMVFALSFFWKVAYHGIDTVEGVDEKQMITYTIISTLLSAAFVFDVEDTVNDRIRQGDIAMDFIKPVDLFGIYLAQDIGSVVSSVTLKVLPLFIVSSAYFDTSAGIRNSFYPFHIQYGFKLHDFMAHKCDCWSGIVLGCGIRTHRTY